MKILFSTAIRILFCMIILLSGAGCGRSLVRGKVIDDETGKPIEGAVYAIYWYRDRAEFVGPGAVREDIEKNADGVTDAEGNFEVPKYSIRPFRDPTFEMGVYKKGYVMWCNEAIMYPENYDETNAIRGKPDLHLFEKMKWELKNGAIVRMRPWKEGYAEKRHAQFACGYAHTLHSVIMSGAVISECDLEIRR